MSIRDATLTETLRDVRARFAEAGVGTADLDARALIAGVLDVDATRLITRDACPVDVEDRIRLEAAVVRRLAGEPVFRILGHRPFYGLELELSPATLEPRPDTEILVDAALVHVRRIAAARGTCRIVDMGTGTGAICLALLDECPAATGVGVDISAEALETAARNAARNGLGERFSTVLSDWFHSVAGSYDVIVANPPYICSGDLKTLPREVRDHDPAIALDGGDDGLEPYRVLAGESRGHLADGGVVAIEFGATQRQAVQRIFRASGFEVVSSHDDLAGRNRACVVAPVQADSSSAVAAGTG